MTRDEYDAIEATNFSTLKLMARSPANYRHNLLEGRPDTNALKLGRATHIAVFEPEKFAGAVARWEGGTRRGKDWDVFCAEHKTQDILTEAEHDMCLSIGAAVRADAIAKRFITGGRGEVTLRWTYQRKAMGELPGFSMACKGRVDFLPSAGGICDLKTTLNAEPEKFGRQAFDLEYGVQGAWYHDGGLLADVRDGPYIIIAAEKKAPWVVQCYEVDATAMQLGRERYVSWLDRLNYCREHAEWPGYAVGVLPLELPRWALNETEGVDGADEFGIQRAED
jgi:exodeoxyribonuclease VIII